MLRYSSNVSVSVMLGCVKFRAKFPNWGPGLKTPTTFRNVTLTEVHNPLIMERRWGTGFEAEV